MTTADLAIVGGGPACAHVLAALATRTSPRRIVIVERGAELGPGLPYGDAADPRHTLGRVAVRRRDRGRVLRAQAADAIARLVARGVAIDTRRDTTALGFRRDAGGWTIETDRGDISAARVVLATGHWHVHRLAHVERAVDWRWDVRRLAAIADDEDVVILGTSQSAIDLAIALATPTRRGRLVLASRRGLLPSVWGPVRTTRSPLMRLASRPGVRLDEVLAAVRADLRGAPCGDLVAGEAGGEPTASVEAPATTDGAGLLRADLAIALDARRARREIPWQTVLWPTVPVVFDVFPRLPGEDREALAPRWYPMLRHLEAIHVANARRILELVDAGRLAIRALGDDVVIAEDARGVTATGSLTEARGHRIVDARGPEPRIALARDPFLDAVLASGHAVPGRAPYAERPGHLETGGLWVDPATFGVRDERGRNDATLFALGPLTMGQFPVYLGLWALRRAAARIAVQLAR